MNKTFKRVWNRYRQSYVVVNERAKSHSTGSSVAGKAVMLCVGAMLAAPGASMAASPIENEDDIHLGSWNARQEWVLDNTDSGSYMGSMHAFGLLDLSDDSKLWLQPQGKKDDGVFFIGRKTHADWSSSLEDPRAGLYIRDNAYIGVRGKTGRVLVDSAFNNAGHIFGNRTQTDEGQTVYHHDTGEFYLRAFNEQTNNRTFYNSGFFGVRLIDVGQMIDLENTGEIITHNLTIDGGLDNAKGGDVQVEGALRLGDGARLVLSQGSQLKAQSLDIGTGVDVTFAGGSYAVDDASYDGDHMFNDSTLRFVTGNHEASEFSKDGTFGTNTVYIGRSDASIDFTTDDNQVLGTDWNKNAVVIRADKIDSRSVINIDHGGVLDVDTIALTTDEKTLKVNEGGALQTSLDQIFQLTEGDAQGKTPIVDNDGNLSEIEIAQLQGGPGIVSVKDEIWSGAEFAAGSMLVLDDDTFSLATVKDVAGKMQMAGYNGVETGFLGELKGEGSSAVLFTTDLARDLAQANQKFTFVQSDLFNDPQTNGTTLVFGQQDGEKNSIDASLGFRTIHGVEQVIVNNDRDLTLVGENARTKLTHGANVSVADHSTLYLGTNALTQGTGGQLADLSLEGEGGVVVRNGVFSVKALTASAGQDDSRRVNVQDDASLAVAQWAAESTTLTNDGDLTVDNWAADSAKIINTGTMTLTSGLAVKSGRITNNGTVDFNEADVNIGQQATFDATGGNVENVKNLTNSGTVKVDALTLSEQGKVHNAGTLTAKNVALDGLWQTVQSGHDELESLAIGQTGIYAVDSQAAVGSLSMAGGQLKVNGTIAFDEITSTDGAQVYLNGAGKVSSQNGWFTNTRFTLNDVNDGQTITETYLRSEGFGDGNTVVVSGADKGTHVAAGNLANTVWVVDNKGQLETSIDQVFNIQDQTQGITGTSMADSSQTVTVDVDLGKNIDGMKFIDDEQILSLQNGGTVKLSIDGLSDYSLEQAKALLDPQGNGSIEFIGQTVEHKGFDVTLAQKVAADNPDGVLFADVDLLNRQKDQENTGELIFGTAQEADNENAVDADFGFRSIRDVERVTVNNGHKLILTGFEEPGRELVGEHGSLAVSDAAHMQFGGLDQKRRGVLNQLIVDDKSDVAVDNFDLTLDVGMINGKVTLDENSRLIGGQERARLVIGDGAEISGTGQGTVQDFMIMVNNGGSLKLDNFVSSKLLYNNGSIAVENMTLENTFTNQVGQATIGQMRMQDEAVLTVAGGSLSVDSLSGTGKLVLSGGTMAVDTMHDMAGMTIEVNGGEDGFDLNNDLTVKTSADWRDTVLHLNNLSDINGDTLTIGGAKLIGNNSVRLGQGTTLTKNDLDDAKIIVGKKGKLITAIDELFEVEYGKTNKKVNATTFDGSETFEIAYDTRDSVKLRADRLGTLTMEDYAGLFLTQNKGDDPISESIKKDIKDIFGQRIRVDIDGLVRQNTSESGFNIDVAKDNLALAQKAGGLMLDSATFNNLTIEDKYKAYDPSDEQSNGKLTFGLGQNGDVHAVDGNFGFGTLSGVSEVEINNNRTLNLVGQGYVGINLLGSGAKKVTINDGRFIMGYVTGEYSNSGFVKEIEALTEDSHIKVMHGNEVTDSPYAGKYASEKVTSSGDIEVVDLAKFQVGDLTSSGNILVENATLNVSELDKKVCFEATGDMTGTLLSTGNIRLVDANLEANHLIFKTADDKVGENKFVVEKSFVDATDLTLGGQLQMDADSVLTAERLKVVDNAYLDFAEGATMDVKQLDMSEASGNLRVGEHTNLVIGEFDALKGLSMVVDGTVTLGEDRYAGLEQSEESRNAFKDRVLGLFEEGFQANGFLTVGNQITLGEEGRLTVGQTGNRERASGANLTFNKDSVTVFSTDQFDKTTPLFKADADNLTASVAQGANIVLHNVLDKNGQYVLMDGFDLSANQDGEGNWIGGWNAEDETLLISDNTMIDWDVRTWVDANGRLMIEAVRKSSSEDYPDVIGNDEIDEALAGRITGPAADFVNEVMKIDPSEMSPAQKTALLNKVKEISGLMGTAGLFANNIQNAQQTVFDQSSLTQGQGLWVVADGGSYTSDGLELATVGKTDTDITSSGMTVGWGAQVRRNLRLGMAGSYRHNKSTNDNLGASAKGYTAGAQMYGDLRVSREDRFKGSVGYFYQEDDIDLNLGLETAKQAKATVQQHAVAAAAEYSHEFNLNGIKVAPHIGVRVAMIDTKDFDTEIDGQTAYVNKQDKFVTGDLPLGMRIKARFKAGAWTLEPMGDLTIAPKFGRQTDTNVSVAGTQLNWDINASTATQASVSGQLGFAASKGKLNLGTSYGYAGGDKGHTGHTLKMNLNYNF